MLNLVWLSFIGAIAFSEISPQARGKQIAEKVYNRKKGKDSIILSQMVLASRSGKKRVRSLTTYQRRPKKGFSQQLIRFTGPKNIKDTGMLTIDKSGQDSNQRVFLPKLGRPRRITSSGQGGRFVGSDFFYEDLKDRPVPKDRHTFIKKDSLDGVAALVIESVPVDKKNSSYSKRRVWVHPKIWVPLKVLFFQKSKKPVKQLLAQRIEQIDGIWTVMVSEMKSFKKNHTTTIENTSVRYNQGLKNELFSPKVLTDPAREKSYL